MTPTPIAIGVLLTGVAFVTAFAQQSPAFEVISIKRNASGQAGGSIGIQPGGRFVMVPARMLVIDAIDRPSEN